MAQVAPRPLTVQDYMDLPEGPPYFQLIEGDLYMSPPPLRRHEDIVSNLVQILSVYLAGNPIGKLYFSVFGVFLNDINAYQPDIVFVANEQKHLLSMRGFEGAPDLVVEVLSPSSERADKGPKRLVYGRSGVKEMWIIDPEAKEARVFRFTGESDLPTAVYGLEESFESPIFPGLRLACRKIFSA